MIGILFKEFTWRELSRWPIIHFSCIYRICCICLNQGQSGMVWIILIKYWVVCNSSVLF
jgi:hypothetical protein